MLSYRNLCRYSNILHHYTQATERDKIRFLNKTLLRYFNRETDFLHFSNLSVIPGKWSFFFGNELNGMEWNEQFQQSIRTRPAQGLCVAPGERSFFHRNDCSFVRTHGTITIKKVWTRRCPAPGLREQIEKIKGLNFQIQYVLFLEV